MVLNGARRSRTLRVMHFAHVINRYDFIDTVLRGVDRERFEVSAATYLAASTIEDPLFDTAGIPHHVLGVHSRRQLGVAAVSLARLLRAHRIDLLHAHHFDPGAVGWAATRLSPRTRLIVGRHYSDDHHAYLTGVKRRGYLAAESVIHAGATRVITPSRMIEELLIRRQRVPRRKVVVIPYAFDPARYTAITSERRAQVRAELGLVGQFAIATVGRIVPKKGHRFLIAAVRELLLELPDLVWLVVGDGPGRAEVEAQARAAGIARNVRFTGWRTDALAVMAAAEAIVQPTLQEAFSQAMVEALWMGVPLVMTDVSGARDVISAGETGMLVPPADATALSAAIRRLHDDPALRARLAAAGRAHVGQTLTLSAVLPRFEQVYDEAMGR